MSEISTHEFRQIIRYIYKTMIDIFNICDVMHKQKER